MSSSRLTTSGGGTPLVSFVVPAYNTEPYIGECIRSILGQEGGYDYEIIIIDDHSLDGTEAAVRSFSDPRISYIRHKQNQGSVVTINEGFDLARGRYVARIDSDDRYRPDFLAQTVPILEQHSEVGMVYGDIAMIDADGRTTQEKAGSRPAGIAAKGKEFWPILRKNYIPAPTVIARREAWSEGLPIPDGFTFSDWYLTLQIARKWELFYLDRVLADYRIHGKNMHHAMIRDKKGEEITFSILDTVFADQGLSTEDKKMRGDIYGTHYAELGDKYFGCGMFSDARRCYLKAFSLMPGKYLQPPLMRRFAATFLGKNLYETLKRCVKGSSL